MQHRAVADTNVLVSAMLKRGGPPDALAQAIRHGLLQPVVCAEIVEEYSVVLQWPRRCLPQVDMAELMALFAIAGRVGARHAVSDRAQAS